MRRAERYSASVLLLHPAYTRIQKHNTLIHYLRNTSHYRGKEKRTEPLSGVHSDFSTTLPHQAAVSHIISVCPLPIAPVRLCSLDHHPVSVFRTEREIEMMIVHLFIARLACRHRLNARHPLWWKPYHLVGDNIIIFPPMIIYPMGSLALLNEEYSALLVKWSVFMSIYAKPLETSVC